MVHPSLLPYCDLCWAEGDEGAAAVRYWSDEAKRPFFACQSHTALLDRVGKPYKYLGEIIEENLRAAWWKEEGR